MIQITERDKKIKEFLEEVQIADTKTLSILFFSNTTLRNCQKRLKQLVEIKYIKCYRENVLSQNIYYSKYKPKNIKHKIIFSKLLGRLKEEGIDVLKYRCPFPIGDVIADGLIVIKVNNEIKIYFVEGERTKKLNINKYLDLYYSRKYKDIFPIMPGILVITDKKITKNNVLNIKSCKWNLENINL